MSKIITNSPYPGTDIFEIIPERNDYISLFNKTTSETPYSNEPFIASTNLTYTKPNVVLYPNLNTSPEVIKKIINYFRYKFLDDWIYEENIKKLINKIKTGNTFQIKIKIIENKILTKNKIYSILLKFVEHTKKNWYDLTKYESYVKEALIIGFKKLIDKYNKN